MFVRGFLYASTHGQDVGMAASDAFPLRVYKMDSRPDTDPPYKKGKKREVIL